MPRHPIDHALTALSAMAFAILGPAAAAAKAPVTAMQLVSIGIGGASANNVSNEPVFSPDGKKVAFTSSASNLVSGDNNGLPDVFVATLATGAIQRVSVSAAGVEGNGQSTTPAFSPDGTKIVFVSRARNLVAGDTNSVDDIFVKTLATGAIQRVSTKGANIQANGNSWGPSFSPDGASVIFTSAASNLAPNDTNLAYDVFVKTLATGAVRQVSKGSGGQLGGCSSNRGSFSPATAVRVVFDSCTSDFVSDDANGLGSDIFVKALAGGLIKLVSRASSGASGNGASSEPAFSPNGNLVAFASFATNLVSPTVESKRHIYVKTLSSGAIVRASASVAGAAGNAHSYSSSAPFSRDNRRLAFSSYASNLVPNDTNGLQDVFVKTLASGKIIRVSVSPAGAQANGTVGSDRPAFSPADNKIVFTSDATNLGPVDTNAFYDIYVATLAP